MESQSAAAFLKLEKYKTSAARSLNEKEVPSSPFLLKAERNELKLKTLRSLSQGDDKRKREKISPDLGLRSGTMSFASSLLPSAIVNRKKAVKQVSLGILRVVAARAFASFHFVRPNQGKLSNFDLLQATVGGSGN